MGMFETIAEVDVSKGGNYFKEGLYRVRIKLVKAQESTSTPGKHHFIIETEVLESSNPEIAVGGERSQVITMGQQMSLPNVKGFVAAVSGVDPLSENINEEVEAYWQAQLGEHTPFSRICDLIVSSANPLEGLEMGLECVEITTKKEKKPFTKHNWQPRAV